MFWKIFIGALKMKKTFKTSYNKDEIIKILKELNENYDKYCKKMIFYMTCIKVEDKNKILVNSGRSWISLYLDLNTSGEITVQRKLTIFEHILIGTFVAVDVILILLFLLIDIGSISHILLLAGVEFLAYYPMYIFFPMMSIKGFVKRFLGGVKSK